MRRTVCLLAALLVLPSLGSDAPKEYDGRTEYVGIEGTWRRTWERGDVEKGNPNRKFSITLTLRAGTYTRTDSDGETDRGRYHIDRTCNPPHLDRIPSDGPAKGETFKFIYEIDGDTLRIAQVASWGALLEHPKGFNDARVVVTTYKRVK